MRTVCTEDEPCLSCEHGVGQYCWMSTPVVLSAEAFDAFVAEMENPSPPNEALCALFGDRALRTLRGELSTKTSSPAAGAGTDPEKAQ